MRITEVDGIVYRQRILHRDAVRQHTPVTRHAHDTVLVRVATDTGLVGWGEAFGHFGVAPVTLSALKTLVAPQAIGQSPFDATGDAVTLTDRLTRTLHPLGASGPVTYALSGLDIALWDLLGKRTGKPLHALLGGARTSTLPAYASLMRYANPAAVSAEVAEAIDRRGVAVKLHEIGLDEIRAAAKVVQPSGTPLMLDVNCAWSVDEAEAVTRALDGTPVHWLEEPVWPPDDHQAMATLRARTSMPIAAGENASSPGDFLSMLRQGAVDYAQPSVTKIGGLTNLVRLAAATSAQGARLAPHTPYFGPGLLATLHYCAANAPDTWIEHLFYDLEPGPFGAWIAPRNGRFELPEGPGLGIGPDLERLQALRL